MITGICLTVLAFIGGLLLTPSDFATHQLLHVVVAGVLALMVLLYFLVVVKMKKQQIISNEKNFEAGEQIMLSEQKHRVVSYSLVSTSGFLSLVAAIITVWLRFNHPSVSFVKPSLRNLSGAEDPTTITIPIWPLGLIIVALSAYLAVYVWEDLKHTYYIVTDRRELKLREIIPYMPWLGRMLEQSPFDMVVDIDQSTGHIGNVAGWGKVTITKRLHEGSDRVDQLVKRTFIPDHEHYARVLREAKKAWTDAQTQQTQPPRLQETWYRSTNTLDQTQEFPPVPPPSVQA
jgi:hypothetical protein